MTFSIPAPWQDRFRALGALRHPSVGPVVLVGGCVRDMLLGRAPLDWDVMAEGDIAPLLDLGRSALGAVKTVRHAAFLTATLHFADGTFLDVVTARTETYPRPAALPVVRRAPLLEDFRRRDFTANALAVRITPEGWGEMLDPLGGRADLERGLLRVLHDASFVDDPTRLYRAARYAGRYGWTVEPRTRALIQEAVRDARPALLSPARRRNELTHLLEEADAAPAMRLLWDWGLWPFWGPSLRWTPALAAALAAPAADPLPARLAALAEAGDRAAVREDLARLAFPRSLLARI